MNYPASDFAKLTHLSAVTPITGTPALMCHGRDEDSLALQPIDYDERKPADYDPTQSSSERRAGIRVGLNESNRSLNLGGELRTEAGELRFVEPSGLAKLRARLRMKPGFGQRRARRTSANPSEAGIVSALPRSISAHRASASIRHPSSMSPASAGSRERSIARASSARSLGESWLAFCSSSASAFGIRVRASIFSSAAYADRNGRSSPGPLR